MQIVINIPKGFYEHVKGHKDIFTYGLINGEKIGDIIANGTVLSEQHGDLIDRDELLTSERPNGIADDVWKESYIYKLLSNAPTILETREGRG